MVCRADIYSYSMALPPFVYLRSCLLLAALYWISAKAGLALAWVNPSATAVWPPAGLAMAAVLVYGPKVWPGILLGAVMANATTAGSLATSLVIGLGNLGEALLGGYLVSRRAHGRLFLHTGKQIVLFVLFAGLASPIVSATTGVTAPRLASNNGPSGSFGNSTTRSNPTCTNGP